MKKWLWGQGVRVRGMHMIELCTSISDLCMRHAAALLHRQSEHIIQQLEVGAWS